MARMIRVNKIYGPDAPIPVGQNKFYTDIVLKDENDPYIPGTKIRRLRLANLGDGIRVGFEDEIEAIGEAVRAMRDALAEQTRAAAAAEPRVEHKKVRAKRRVAGEAA
jgi:hypothetical protein